MQISLLSFVKTRKAQWIQLEILLFAAVMITTACVPAFFPPTPKPFVQPESPLIPGKNLTLAENRWRVIEIMQDEQQVAFDVIQPIYITFSTNGFLGVRAMNCNSGGYSIIAESEQSYRLVPGNSTAKGCGEIGDKQEADIHTAIAATVKYELKNKQLILTGEGVQVVLEIDNPQ